MGYLIVAIVSFGIVFFDSAVFNNLAMMLYSAMLLDAIINGIIYSGKKYACFKCGHNFRQKWYRLAWQYPSWRMPRRFRENSELNGITYEKVWVKCPNCKSWDCGAEKRRIIQKKHNNNLSVAYGATSPVRGG